MATTSHAVEAWLGPMGFTNPAFILMVYAPLWAGLIVGVVLVAFLFHAQMNGPAWPDAQPWDMVGFVLVALVVVVANRSTILRRGSGSTDVLLARALADEAGDRS